MIMEDRAATFSGTSLSLLFMMAQTASYLGKLARPELARLNLLDDILVKIEGP
jgi:hypothetical protein